MIPDLDPEAVAARYLKTGSIRQTAREFACTVPRVKRRLRWMGLLPPPDPSLAPHPPRPEPAGLPLKALTPAQAAALYAAGRSVAFMAREFACHPQTVRRRLKEAGVALKSPWQPAADHPPMWRILPLHFAGYSLRQIAQQVGCSDQTVARYLDLAEVRRVRRRDLAHRWHAEIGHCLVAGLSLRQTAKRLGLGVATVWRAKEALGLGYTDRGKGAPR
jgi:transposase